MVGEKSSASQAQAFSKRGHAGIGEKLETPHFEPVKILED